MRKLAISIGIWIGGKAGCGYLPPQSVSSDWILFTGFWNDAGIWVDNEIWRD